MWRIVSKWLLVENCIMVWIQNQDWRDTKYSNSEKYGSVCGSLPIGTATSDYYELPFPVNRNTMT